MHCCVDEGSSSCPEICLEQVPCKIESKPRPWVQRTLGNGSVENWTWDSIHAEVPSYVYMMGTMRVERGI